MSMFLLLICILLEFRATLSLTCTPGEDCVVNCVDGSCGSNISCADDYNCEVNCNGLNACEALTIDCNNAINCDIVCDGTSADSPCTAMNIMSSNTQNLTFTSKCGNTIQDTECASFTTIECPTNGICSVLCETGRSCVNMAMYATYSRSFHLISHGQFDGTFDKNLQSAVVYCPNSHSDCTISGHSGGKSLNGLTVHGRHDSTFNDVNFECVGNGPCFEQNQLLFWCNGQNNCNVDPNILHSCDTTQLATVCDVQMQYIYVNQRLNWINAEHYCMNTFGTHLASIRGQMEYDAMHSLFTNEMLWIGLNDLKTADNWAWSDGTKCFGNNECKDYTFWIDGEPDFAHQNCALYDGANSGWRNAECFEEKYFVCNNRSRSLTLEPTTNPTTNQPTTAMPSTVIPTTNEPTTPTPTTASITNHPTTVIPTTNVPTTVIPSTNMPTLFDSITNEPTDYLTIPDIAQEQDMHSTINTESFEASNKDNHSSHSNAMILIIVIVSIGPVLIGILVFTFVYFKKKSQMKTGATNVENMHRKQREFPQKRVSSTSRITDGTPVTLNNNTPITLTMPSIQTKLSISQPGSREGSISLNNNTNIYALPNLPVTPVIILVDKNKCKSQSTEDNSENNSENDLKMWLFNSGMIEYYNLFVSNGFDNHLNLLSQLTNNDLREMGITKMAHRLILLAEIETINRRNTMPEYGEGIEYHNRKITTNHLNVNLEDSIDGLDAEEMYYDSNMLPMQPGLSTNTSKGYESKGYEPNEQESDDGFDQIMYQTGYSDTKH